MKAKSMAQMATAVAADAAEAPHGGVADARLGALLADLVGVGLEVDEAERVERLEAGVALLEAVGVEQVAQPRVDAQPEVVSAAWADAQVLLELLVVDASRCSPGSSSRGPRATTRGAAGRAGGWALRSSSGRAQRDARPRPPRRRWGWPARRPRRWRRRPAGHGGGARRRASDAARSLAGPAIARSSAGPSERQDRRDRAARPRGSGRRPSRSRARRRARRSSKPKRGWKRGSASRRRRAVAQQRPPSPTRQQPARLAEQGVDGAGRARSGCLPASRS